MKFKHIALMSLALAASFSSCSDYLEQEPPSSLPSDGFFTSEAKVKAAADQFYGDVLPGHANWSYGLYAGDVNTDNQINWNGDGKFATGLWKQPMITATGLGIISATSITSSILSSRLRRLVRSLVVRLSSTSISVRSTS